MKRKNNKVFIAALMSLSLFATGLSPVSYLPFSNAPSVVKAVFLYLLKRDINF